MRIVIAADHNGADLKRRLIGMLAAAGHQVTDRPAAPDADGIIDYPPLCADVGRLVAAGEADRGIVVGGSGQGEHIACNKIRGVRAGLCFDRFTTEISRANNDSNVLVIGAKVLPADTALDLTRLWLATPFAGGRHQRRLDQIAAIERGEPLD